MIDSTSSLSPAQGLGGAESSNPLITRLGFMVTSPVDTLQKSPH